MGPIPDRPVVEKSGGKRPFSNRPQVSRWGSSPSSSGADVSSGVTLRLQYVLADPGSQYTQTQTHTRLGEPDGSCWELWERGTDSHLQSSYRLWKAPVASLSPLLQDAVTGASKCLLAANLRTRLSDSTLQAYRRTR